MINFNRTTEYAFRIMSMMARDKDNLYKSDDIYQNLQVPFRYLRRLLTILSNEGLLISVQGKYGGFKIQKDLNSISLYEIMQAVQDNKVPNECFFGYEKCPITEKCSMHDKWNSVQSNIIKVLKETTLQTIVDAGDDKILFKSLMQK